MLALLLMPMVTLAQTYQSLWKQVEDARQKDLPQSAIVHLQKISSKASKELAYGQLLKSSLLHAQLQTEIAPDSLRPAVARLERQEAETQDVVLKAVYDAVLSRIYGDNRQLADDWQTRRDDYRQRALAQPGQLAQVTVDGYEPFVVKGKDSDLYGHDLLSVVGAELEAWDVLSAYYRQTGNRRAACLTALEQLKAGKQTEDTRQLAQSDYIRQLDSLLAVYGDLPEAGEVAIERYDYMSLFADVTAADKYRWLQQSLQRWGNWQRANVLHNNLTMLTNPNFFAEINCRVAEVNRPQTVRLRNLRQLQQLTLRVFRTGLQGDTQLNPNNKTDFQQLKGGLQELKELTRTLTFSDHTEYDVFEDSLVLAGLPAGVYLLEFATQPQTQTVRYLYFVSGLRVLMQAQPDQSMRYVVVDATTGQPVAGAKLRLSFRQGWQKPAVTKTVDCNRQGEALYSYKSDRQPSTVFAYTATDVACPEYNAWGGYSYYERTYGNDMTSVFTDRAIYRPGQTVHATAIVWRELSPTESMAVADKSMTFELRDANYKLVAEQQATTDRYGKCSAVFTLPTGQLNGYFSVRTTGGSRSFRVEEYKRPTFQVEFPDYKESYQNGDTIHAQAKAVTYAGVPVQGGKVHYTVKRRVAWWWLNYSWYWNGGIIGRSVQDEVMNEGNTVTADDGTFTVDMPMVLPKELGRHAMFYNFVVEANVTDVAGETHNGTMTLPLGSRPTALTCDLPQQVRSDQLPRVTFTRRNAAGNEIDGQVRYRIDGGKWKDVAANASLPIFNSQLKSGSHRLEALCDADSIDMTFVVFGLDDKRPATTTDDWFYVSHEQFPADGSPVTVQVGASDPDLHIVYAFFAGKKLVESGAVEKNAQLVNRKLTYQEVYGNGLLLTFAWVKNGQCHQHQSFIRRPLPDRKLKMTWETFRDRLTPGQQEEWRLKIQSADGRPVDASLLAVLYDKSLDAIVPHEWNFSPVTALQLPSTGWRWQSWGSLVANGAKDYQLLKVTEPVYSSFDHSVYPYYIAPYLASRRLMVRGGKLNVMSMDDMATGEVLKAKEVVYDAAPPIGASMANAVETQESKVEAEEQQAQGARDVPSVRENLNETAFCYPALTTDSAGLVTLRFTLPESLTTWRFMGVSNTTDMHYGFIEGEAVAKKDVMILPNVPRFIRMGDEATISARIFNTTDRAVSGKSRLQLVDPETERVVYEQEAPFAVAAGQTDVSTYRLPSVAYQQSLLICRMTASGDGFSDGEQHYLPVLPDREYVTQTVPFTQHEPSVKNIDLTKLFPQGATQPKLTIEYTNNPAWLMVQSLATLGQPWEHSAIDQAASYYSNLLAKTLLDRNPQTRTVFEQWKREESSTSTLHASLDKNQDLKDLVLSETPWVAAADRETEQKQRLADFFNENAIGNRLATAAEKLQKLQHDDGSFSWYPGMEGSTAITVAVAEMLVRLNVMVGQDNARFTLHAPLTAAFDYIGKDMTDLVAKMKQEEKKGHRQTFPSFTALRWLYLCAVDGRQLSASVRSANEYLIGLLKKDIKRQTIYEKALTAVVLAQHNEKTKAAEYVKSLKEYTVYTEEMGRYYDTRRAAYSWYDYKIPTEVAAIEAIQRVTPDDRQTVDEMRRWLLQEKRTQMWDTPINSVNAIWAFLNGNSQQLTANSQQPTVLAIDGTPVDTPAATAALGYVKTAIGGSAIGTAQTFSATKTSDGTSWGAVYAQFFQKTADIEASQSGITVKRELLTPDAQHPASVSRLTVGSRLRVRITIETTRDLDFVQVVNRRAACMEPVRQLSGYQYGAYVSPKDFATHYFYRGLAKGKHVIETEYYIDRAGSYETGTCTVGCAYAPEYRATAPSVTIQVTE